MPPDVYQHDRLQKVLKGLEAEAAAEQLVFDKKKELIESSKGHSRANSSGSAEVDIVPPAKAPDSKSDVKKLKILHSKGLVYADDGEVFAIVWSRIAFFGTIHVLYAVGLIVAFNDWYNGSTTVLKTVLFGWILFLISALGVTGGAHRLWSHKSYQARWPLRVFYMLGHCLAGQNTLFNWCRDHRVHHKFSETDCDPHNSKRGFFYAHVGWLLIKSHPEFDEQARLIYTQDLLNDPVVHYQREHYASLALIFAVILPTFFPIYFWGESLTTAFFIAVIIRYVTALHNTWFVNSAAHMFGEKPYNPRIASSQNSAVSFGALGEGYHNYHHTYPWDYATSELGKGSLNFTREFINLMARLGLAYDMKRVSPERIRRY